MKSIRILPVLLSATSFASSVSAINWKFDSTRATCQGDPFKNVAIAATCTTYFACGSETCSESYACGWGDTTDITGSLTAIGGFSNNQVVAKPCLSAICPKRDSRVVGRVCDWIIPIDSQTCGEAGKYQIDYSMQLPAEESIPRGMGWIFDSLVLKIDVQEAIGCETSVDTEFSKFYPTMGVGIMAGLAVALFRNRRKSRDKVTADEDDETQYDDEAYVEMSSTTSGGSRAFSPVIHHHNLAPENLSDLSQDSEGDSETDRYHNRSYAYNSQRQSKRPPLHPGDCHENHVSVNLPQSPERTSQVVTQTDPETILQSLPPPTNAISLEVLKEWYGNHGIAIV